MSVFSALACKMVWMGSPNKPLLSEMPPGLFARWKKQSHKEFPGIPTDAIFYAKASDGLMSFFRCCAKARPDHCALPSKAADSVWHAWASMDPAGLRSFCKRHFGADIPHTEAADLSAPLDQALAVCWAQACKLDKINPADERVPRLFSLDRDLRMPLGYGYAKKTGGGVAHADLSERGETPDPRSREWVDHPTLAASGLLGLGLVSASLYAQSEPYLESQRQAEREAQRARSSDSSSSGGSSCSGSWGDSSSSSSSSSSCSSSSSSSSASSCSDSGSSSGGSSCGSSCGGGCGS